MPRLFSYTVARDYGFAPNPFSGFCTLATCMPDLRRAADIGDWIIGGGTKTKKRGGYLTYAMRVTEAMTFSQYWSDPRFFEKRPDMHSSLKKAFGDNIYSRDPGSGQWIQTDSHHSYENGSQNPHNLNHDTKTDRVLISDDFIYWGGHGPKVSEFSGCAIYFGRGYKRKYAKEVCNEFISCVLGLPEKGYCGAPLEWN